MCDLSIIKTESAFFVLKSQTTINNELLTLFVRLSLSEIDGQVEALDEFGVFDASDKQFSHLHLEKRWV